MSNLNAGQNVNQPASGKPGGSRKATLIRQGILIAVLLTFGGALAYDYLVARPAAQAAYDKADEFSTSRAHREEVIKELGEPSSTYKKQGDLTIDQYNFRSGLIFRAYKVYVVYTGDGVIETITKDKEPDEMGLADESAFKDKENGSSFADSSRSASELNDNGNGSGRRGDPSQFVARMMENDTDGDGELTGDEIPERMQANFDLIDTNADGALDEDELTAMAERFGGRGRRNREGDSSDRAQRSARPEVEQ